MRAQAHRRRTVRRLIGTIILIVAVFGPTTLYAQVAAASRTVTVTPVAAVESVSPVDSATDTVRLLVGRSTIVDVGKPIARVSLTSADVADAHVTAPNELLINGKAPGTISMFVWDRGGAIRRYDVFVQRDLARLIAQLKELFPKESIDVRANGKTAVLSGTVSSKDVADKMATLAGSFVESKEELVSLLQVGESGRSNQVLLRVRFAEVSRNAMTELGVSLFTGAAGYKNYLARSTTDQTPAPTFDNSGAEKLVFSDFLNLFLFNTKEQLGAVVKALQTKGLFQSLAEPNLIAESGKEASFLAGGEFPVPIAQASGGGTSISVQYKEFGVRLSFTPVVIGNRVHLKVRPEVSTLDFTNAVTLNGFRIPALSTRRTETEVELNDGQTFAIAGLMNNTMNTTMQKIPGIGDIPILGLLFKSKAAQKNQTELVVMITPEILANNSPGVTPNLPKLAEPYLPPITMKKDVPVPAPAFKAADAQPAAPATRTQAEPLVAPAKKPAAISTEAKPSPAAGAALLKQQSPATRIVVHPPAPAPAANAASTSGSATPATAAAATSASVPVSAAESTSPATAAAESASRPVSAAERKAAERADKEQRQRDELEARAMAAEAQRRAKQAEVDARKQKEEDVRTAKANRVQAQRDAELAKQAAEAAKKQAEIDKKHEQEIADAQNRLRAAQLRYQSELAKH
jgi:pilus assembly protein CpaC